MLAGRLPPRIRTLRGSSLRQNGACHGLDILIHATDAAEARQRLVRAGFSHLGPLSIGGGAPTLCAGNRQSAEGFPVDVIESAEAWVQPALAEARSKPDPHGMFVLPLPYLILMKYRASRLQDIADVGRMLGQATDDQMAAIRSVIARWEPGGQEDLESLVTLGRLEME